MSDVNYSYEDVIQVGQEAQNILQNPIFGMAYSAVLEDLQKRFFETEPGHTRSLEELRREGNSLAKVIGNLNKAVLQAQQIVAAQNAQRGEA
jgi:hypothetical protein